MLTMKGSLINWP